MSEVSRVQDGWSSHGWWIGDGEAPDDGPDLVARCGGPGMCPVCKSEKATLVSRVQEPDLTGKLVRWECQRQWFTARVGGTGTQRGTWRGEVVDPGNYVGLSLFAPKQAVKVGQWLPNLVGALLTVIDEETPGIGHPDEHDELCEETGCWSEIDGGGSRG